MLTWENNVVFCDIVGIFRDPRFSQCKDIETVSGDRVQDKSGFAASGTGIEKAKLHRRRWILIVHE